MYSDEVVNSVLSLIDERKLKKLYVSIETDIPYQRLSRILNKRSEPSVDEFIKLCKFAKIDIKELIQSTAKAPMLIT